MLILGISLGILIGVIICYIVSPIELFNNDDDKKTLVILKNQIEAQSYMLYQKQKDDALNREECFQR